MTQSTSAATAIAAAALLAVCACATSTPEVRETTAPPEATAQPEKAKAPSYPARAVTGDIKAGIERHVEEQSVATDGHFLLTFRDKELKLKLVRVHIEYLAALTPTRNFACVDLVDTDGEVYDVDFFLEGPPDDMTVVETTVHKINGRPLYAWAQREDRTWHRVPMEEASSALLGVVEDKDRFEFVYTLELPELKAAARMWLPVATSDAFQTIESTKITAPGTRSMVDEPKHGNKVLVLDLKPEDSGKTIEMRYVVTRLEKGSYPEPLPDPAAFLHEDQLVPFTDDIRALGAEAIAGKDTELMKGRALYDHVMDRMSYKKVGEGWGKGDAIYACDSRTGNCSDYHAYFIGVARSVGIPSRFAVGVSIPSSRNDGGISGYHCWAEFYADGKWWPVDISEADKYSNLSSYYFGHHPANRLELSRGRYLVLDAAPASGPISFLAYPLLEVADRPVRVKPTFSFTRLPAL